MGNLILLEKQRYGFKGQKYIDGDLDILKRKMGKNIRIILLDCSIFIQRFTNVTTDVEKYIEEQFIERMHLNNDILIHYFYIKKIRDLYVYSINDVSSVKKLIPNIVNLKVIPIQFIIHKYVSKKLRNSSFKTIITKVNNNIHIINCENKVIVNCKLLSFDEFQIYLKSLEELDNKQIVGDKAIENLLPKNIFSEITFLDIGRYLNEKVFKI